MQGHYTIRVPNDNDRVEMGTAVYLGFQTDVPFI